MQTLDAVDEGAFAWLPPSGGTRLLARGVAAICEPGAAHELLAEVDADDELGLPGTGAVAVGALPFDPGATGAVVVPATVVGRRGGRAWVTEIEPSAPDAPSHPEHPTRFSVAAPRPFAAWRRAVRTALAEIAAGSLEKVVLAREVVVEADRDFDFGEVIRHLAVQQPGCFVFAANGLVGASPELLLRRTGDRVESRPLAGTALSDGGRASLDALATSAKDNLEHCFVPRAIADVLRAHCSELEVAATPEPVVFGPVAHLATPIRGRLVAPAPTALDLARALHPTPAVAGTPREAALEAIARLEGFDRGRYAGPVGWVDARGDGEWAIALRCAELDGPRARLVAGAGIVAGSDPNDEWNETQAKLEPMLRALVRP